MNVIRTEFHYYISDDSDIDDALDRAETFINHSGKMNLDVKAISTAFNDGKYILTIMYEYEVAA